MCMSTRVARQLSGMSRTMGNSMSGCVFPNARQCSARSKRTGCRCRAPAETGKTVCRFPGARAGAPRGTRNGNYRHGLETKQARLSRSALAELIRAARGTAGSIC